MNNDNWDYKIIRKTPDGHEVLIFAPNETIWRKFQETAQKVNLSIEAIEPEKVASNRNANPILGLAQKKDLKGNDADVLNIATDLENNKKVDKTKSVLGKILVILLLLTISIGGVFLFIKYKQNNHIEINQTTTPSTIVATPTTNLIASPTEIEINLKDVKMQVLNGSGVPGEAGKIMEILKDEGFENIEIGNAENYNYKGVTVKQKDGSAQIFFETIDRALNDKYKTVLENSLIPNNLYEIVVIVGRQL